MNLRSSVENLKHHDNEPGWLIGLFMVVFFIVIGLILFAEVEIARNPSQSVWTGPIVPVGRHAATIKQIHDGDTLQATIHFPLGVDLRDQTIRAADFDAWELSRTRQTIKVTNEEIAKGKAARDALSELLANGTLVIELGNKPERDAYGRVLAKWFVQKEGTTISVAEFMQKHGHVRK